MAMTTRIPKRAFVALALTAAAGLGVARLAVHAAEPVQSTVTGRLTVELLRDAGDGQWSVADRVQISANFPAALVRQGGAVVATSDYTWRGTSARGRALTVRWSGPVRSTFDPATGSLAADVTLDVTVDRTHLTVPARLTTGSARSPLAAVRGRPASLVNHTLSAGLVAASPIGAAVLAETPAGRGRATPRAAAHGRAYLVIRVDGQVARH
jgi:hypothetical protein